MLRSLALALALAVAAPTAAVLVVRDASAQPNPGGFVPSDSPPPGEPAPGSVMRQPEHLTARPSGFWTSTRPAVGGAYRWRIMAMGLAALAITAFFTVRLLRRTSAARPTLARK